MGFDSNTINFFEMIQFFQDRHFLQHLRSKHFSIGKIIYRKLNYGWEYFLTLHKIPWLHLIYGAEILRKTHIFCRDSDDSPGIMWKLCVSTKFPLQEIRCSYGILGTGLFIVCQTYEVITPIEHSKMRQISCFCSVRKKDLLSSLLSAPNIYGKVLF